MLIFWPYKGVSPFLVESFLYPASGSPRTGCLFLFLPSSATPRAHPNSSGMIQVLNNALVEFHKFVAHSRALWTQRQELYIILFTEILLGKRFRCFEIVPAITLFHIERPNA